MFNLIKTVNDMGDKPHVVEPTTNLLREAKDRVANRHGNVYNIQRWITNTNNYPQHYSSSNETIFRKYNYEDLYSSDKKMDCDKTVEHYFKIKNIDWINNEKNID